MILVIGRFAACHHDARRYSVMTSMAIGDYNRGMTVTKFGPWTQTSTRRVYENPWIDVRQDEVITPAGTEGIYGVVHFKNIAVGIIPVDQHGNTFLVGQYRYTLTGYSWEIPMGGCPVGTSPVETASRELREETGLVAGDYEQILRVHLSNSVSDEEGYVFVARDLTKGDMALEDTEDIQVKELALDEAIGMAQDGRITDALSVAGLLRLASMIR